MSDAIMNAMRLKSDNPGCGVEPAADRPSMGQKQGLLVHASEPPPGLDIVQVIRDDREERIHKLAGL